MKSSPKKTTILFDASPLLVNKTGVAYYTERLVLGLAKHYENELQLHGFFYNFLSKRGVEHFPSAPNLRFFPVRLLPSKILYQLRRWGIEFPVETLYPGRADFILYPNFLGYPTRRGTPSACVIHDLTFVDLPEYVSAKNGSDLRRFVPEQIKRSAFVITVSEFSRQKIAKMYDVPLDKIIVTPIPADPPRVYPDEQRAETLQRLDIAKPYILFLGTIEPRKNVLNLLEAYKQLPEHLRNKFTLVVVGRVGWNCDAEVAALKQIVADGYGVRYVGYVDDDTRSILYHGATLFTTASHYEGFGMPVLEALSYGKPSAVSNIPVFKEVGGNAVEYFDQTKPESIAATWTRLLDDPKKLVDMARASRQHADSHSWDDVSAIVHDAVMKHLKRR
jgi:alpha-1,3-rhamnosyl/mannosyltransferase